jgi:hypothetical protein
MDVGIVHILRTQERIILKLIEQNNMLKIKLPVIVFAVALLGFVSACKKDIELPETPDIQSIEEVEGDVRDRFLGTWTVSETSKLLGSRNYQVRIEKDSLYPARVNLYNLYLLGENVDSVRANVSSVLVDAITIPNQQTVQSNNSIGGAGKMIDDNNISFDFTVDDGNGIDTVSASFVR